MFNKLYYGAAFYPELWSMRVVREDIRHMTKVGINVVRMGEFAWAKMEPNRDEISLHFFIDVIGLLHRNGIETIFCTPTPTPPIWLVAEHPEALAINEEGRRFVHGARQHVCTNHPFMRERSRIIVEATAKAVGKLPGVVAWQTDNEFKCHVAECYCETCRKLWARWLEERYGTIEALNKAWGAEIWSERYQDFSQVPQPLKTPFVHNASLDTMYRLFERDNIMETSCAHSGYLHGFSHPHPAGFLTVEALAAFSAGAMGFSFWLMRQQHAGCEQNHGSLVHSWGAPTIGYEPAQRARKEIRRLEPLLLESEPARAEAAIAYSDRAKVDFMAENIGGFNYNGHMMDIVQVALQELGLPRDFLFEDLDFSGYKLLLTPFLPHLPAEYLERAKRFVEKGGVWIVGPLTSFRTAEHTVPTDAALTKPLEDFAGVRTRFFHPISKTGAQGEAFGITSPLSQLSAIFDTTTATAKGTILGGLTPGASFLTEQKRGKGGGVTLDGRAQTSRAANASTPDASKSPPSHDASSGRKRVSADSTKSRLYFDVAPFARAATITPASRNPTPRWRRSINAHVVRRAREHVQGTGACPPLSFAS